MAELPCGEFSEFKVREDWFFGRSDIFSTICAGLQEALQQMRALDDRIIYKLNTSVPTQSFAGQVGAEDRCKQLYQEVGRPIRGWSSLLL